MLHNAVRCTSNGMGFVLVGDPVQEVCSARRLARQALITLLMALALADAVLLGSFGPVDPLAHGNGLHVIDRPHIVRRVRRVFAASFVGLGNQVGKSGAPV